MNDLYSTMIIAKAYNDLGWAVQEQVDAVIEDSSEETLCDQNVNALVLIAEFFETVAYNTEGDASDEATELAAEIRAYTNLAGV